MIGGFYGLGDYGAIKHQNGEYIATLFAHVFWLPIWPFESYYNVEGGDELTLRTPYRYWLHPLSVLLAYLRVYLPIVAFTAGFNLQRNEPTMPVDQLWAILIVAALLWPVSLFAFRGSGGSEAAERERLGRVAGIHALPGWLREDRRIEIRDLLEEEWGEIAQKDFLLEDWEETILAGRFSAEHADILYALCTYEETLDDGPEIRSTKAVLVKRYPTRA